MLDTSSIPRASISNARNWIDTSVDEWDAEEVEKETHLCSLCTAENSPCRVMTGRSSTYDELYKASLDEKPEQLFLAHIYTQNDVMLKQKEVALNHMTIGTHESSNQALNFTTRPIRDWEDIEDIDDDLRCRYSEHVAGILLESVMV